jgi:hypothetical protein
MTPIFRCEDLQLSEEFAARIALELVGGGTTKLLATLSYSTIFLEERQPFGPVQEGIVQFVAMQQLAAWLAALTSHPIASPIAGSRWDDPKHARFPQIQGN